MWGKKKKESVFLPHKIEVEILNNKIKGTIFGKTANLEFLMHEGGREMFHFSISENINIFDYIYTKILKVGRA